MKFRLLGAAVAGVVSVGCSSGLANADENSYLRALADGGWTTNYPDELLKAGYTICTTLYEGYPDQQVVSTLAANRPDIPPRGAQVMVSAAHSQLCPDAGSKPS